MLLVRGMRGAAHVLMRFADEDKFVGVGGVGKPNSSVQAPCRSWRSGPLPLLPVRPLARDGHHGGMVRDESRSVALTGFLAVASQAR